MGIGNSAVHQLENKYIKYNWKSSEMNYGKLDRRTKRKIWDEGEIVSGYDKDVWRMVQCGAFIKWDMCEDRGDKYNKAGKLTILNPNPMVEKVFSVVQDLYKV